MNYDKMSVEELLPLYNWNIINATLGKTTEAAAGRKGFELFTAIRKAVIREASVGNVVISTDDIHETHFAAYSRDCGLIGDCGVADGDYDLIPKG